MKTPKISVVIPAHNEAKVIENCIASLKNQSYKNMEIIVVDDGSTDKTREILSKSDITVLEQNHQGPGAARNLGVKNSKGEIIILVDSDMTFDKEYIKELIQPILDSETFGTAHGQEIASNVENIWARCWGKQRIPKTREHKIFRAIKKQKFLEMGGFDPKYGYADDQTFFLKYRVKSKSVPTAICYHKNPENLKEVFTQSKWIFSRKDLLGTKFKLFNILIILFFAPIFPIMWIPVAIKRCCQHRDFKIFFPMLIFIPIFYFGCVYGLWIRQTKNINYR